MQERYCILKCKGDKVGLGRMAPEILHDDELKNVAFQRKIEKTSALVEEYSM